MALFDHTLGSDETSDCERLRFCLILSTTVFQAMFSQDSESVITSCGQTAFSYAVNRGHFDMMNKILNYYGFKGDLSFWMSPYPHNILSHQHYYGTSYRTTYSAYTQNDPQLLKFCSSENLRLLIYLLQLGADPNVGLMQTYMDFTMLSAGVQRKSDARSCFSGTPLNRIIKENCGHDREMRLLVINCLLYYGANPKFPGDLGNPDIPGSMYYAPCFTFIDKFGQNNEDILPTVQMMVLCGMDIRLMEDRVIDLMLSRVTLDSPAIKQWLLWNVKEPMPLFLCYIL